MAPEQETELLKRINRRLQIHAKQESGKYSLWSALKLYLKLRKEEKRAMQVQQELAQSLREKNLN
jgi:hypothetical protein